MSPADLLAQAITALKPLGVPVLLPNAVQPHPTPERYLILDYVSGTPVATFDPGRPGKRRLIQVTTWCRTYDLACALHEQAGELLSAAGWREGQDRDASRDELYVGIQTDWRFQ